MNELSNRFLEKRPRAFLAFFLFLLSYTGMHAQCSNFQANYPGGVFTSTSNTWTVVANNIYAGEYAVYDVVNGATYEWTNCIGLGFDSQLTVWDPSHTNWYAYNDDYCNVRARVAWTATFTGQVHVLLSRYNCQSNTQNASIRFRMLAAPPSGPSNDDVCAAQPLSVTASCAPVSGTNSAATSQVVGTPSCGSYNGSDVWYSAIVPSSGVLGIQASATSFNDGAMAVYTGDCTSLAEVACDDDSGPGLMPEVILTSQAAGTEVFVRFWAFGNQESGTFNICAYEPPPPPNNDEPCDAIALNVSASCVLTTFSTTSATPSNAVANPSCGNYQGGDVWFKANAGNSGSLIISTASGDITDAAMTVYTGSCGALTEIACDNNSGPGNMPELSISGLLPGQEVTIRLWSVNGNQSGEFEICAYDDCSSVAYNDTPCFAPYLQNGIDYDETNLCATGINEPVLPSCWSTANNSSSVWYRFIANSTQNVRITVFPGTDMVVSRVALYQGDCLNLSEIACALNEPTDCSPSSPRISQLEYSTLTQGQIYYVRVDGAQGVQGDFKIRLSGYLGVDVVTAQDCAGAILVCGDRVSVADPGLQGIGQECEFDGANNCTGGEKNSIWYRVPITANGDFRMILRPNDTQNNSCGPETDYDYLVWKTAGSGPLADCSTITTDAGQGLLSCNYSARGLTGIFDNGNAPTGYATCFNSAFEESLSLQSGDELLIVVQNFSGSTSGFELDMSLSDPGMVGNTNPETLYWDGSANSTWGNGNNWGACGYSPSCDISAVVNFSGANQPVVTGNRRVNDLTVMPGATLTIGSGARFRICGDFKNFGSLDVHPSAIVYFVGDTDQEIIGGMVDDNALGRLFIENRTGTVTQRTEIECQRDFEVRNNDVVYDSRGNALTVGRHFNNRRGDVCFRNIGNTGSLTFNGNGTQNFNPGNSDLLMNEVIVNKTGGYVNMIRPMDIAANTGRIELNSGVIRANSHRITVYNESDRSVTKGNVDSYIIGRLRQYVRSDGEYNFPVSTLTDGYQRATVKFSSNNISYIDGQFFSWGGNVPPALNEADCFTYFDREALDNGYFDLEASNNAPSGRYDIALYNTNYTNAASSSGWTVMKNSGGGFHLDGDCYTSTPDSVFRTGLTGFSRFAVAQASNPLPVEWSSFIGSAQAQGNYLQWVTASEIDNQYFAILRSVDGQEFTEIGQVGGVGNSSVENSYSFLDENYPQGVAYYRLLQVDFDGQSDESETIQVTRRSASSGKAVTIYPNPASSMIHVDFSHLREEEIDIRVLSLDGREVMMSRLEAFSGQNQLRLFVGSLTEGSYLLEARDSNGERLFIGPFMRLE